MKKFYFPLMAICLTGILMIVSCEREPKSQIPNVTFTPCQQDKQNTQGVLKSSSRSGDVVVEFNNNSVQITYNNFAVTCDFSTVNVNYTFVNGFLNITQQGSPSQADCVCYTDVSYTINGILHTEVNVIFINGVQVYCYNDTIIQDACNICGTWEWKNVYDTNSIVTLTIYPITNLVTVSKSPVEMGYYDGFHQFGNGNQYLLQNDTLHRMNPPYGSVFCDHFYDFEITKISENEMELEYLGLVFTDLFHLKHYLFNKIIIE